MASEEALDELERQIHEQMAFHRQQYELAVAPLIRRLTDIQGLRPIRRTITLQEAMAAGLVPTPQPGDNHG